MPAGIACFSRNILRKPEAILQPRRSVVETEGILMVALPRFLEILAAIDMNLTNSFDWMFIYSHWAMETITL